MWTPFRTNKFDTQDKENIHLCFIQRDMAGCDFITQILLPQTKKPTDMKKERVTDEFTEGTNRKSALLFLLRTNKNK